MGTISYTILLVLLLVSIVLSGFLIFLFIWYKNKIVQIQIISKERSGFRKAADILKDKGVVYIHDNNGKEVVIIAEDDGYSFVGKYSPKSRFSNAYDALEEAEKHLSPEVTYGTIARGRKIKLG